MKRAVWLVLFLLIVFASSFSEPLTGFLGIPFGSGKAEVIKAMKAKTTIKPAFADALIVYENIKFEGRDAEEIAFTFHGDSLYSAMVVIIPQQDIKLAVYYQIKSDYIIKYGKPLLDEYYSVGWFLNEDKIILIQLLYNDKRDRYQIIILYACKDLIKELQ